MSTINPNCDGSHCRHGYNEVRKYPSSGVGDLDLCLPCFVNENMRRYQCAKETGGDEDCPQVSWSNAEVIFDKHGDPFDADAAVRKRSSTIIKMTITTASKRAALYHGVRAE